VWPILLEWGGFRLGTYGVLVGGGLLLCLWLARILGQRDGLPKKAVNDVGLAVFVSGFFGSWLLGATVSLLSGVPLAWSTLRTAGAIHGGLLGGLVGLIVMVRIFRLPLPLLLDAYLPSVALGQGIGRLGCFAAGCCFGSTSDAPWAVVFTDPSAKELGGVPLGVHLHPVQLYDASAHFLLCALLIGLHKKGILHGRLFGLWCIAEGGTRLLMETFRGDLGRGVWLGIDWLSTGRLTSGLLVALGASLFALRIGKNRRNAAP
jgi:phosphatidylglycerol:prolipoprotein diacylglycerol transferase